MGTLFRPINWIFGKLGIKRFPAPFFLKNRAIRYVVLGLMLTLLIVFTRLGFQRNLLLYVTGISVIATLFFEESFWHHNICPYGTILGFSARVSPLGLKIDEKNCISCGLCQKVCPSEAISTLADGKRRIIKNECLACFKCLEICPVNVIRYRK